MYIVVNKDLNMSPCKIASQVAHVAEKITHRILKALYEFDNGFDYYRMYLKYFKFGHKKVILKATKKELIKLKSEEGSEYIIDDVRTEIPENNLNVIGFLLNDYSEKFKKYRLLNDNTEKSLKD